tara:strand:- start:944 stop:1063 length:120 start_codon:yes stop_codon:yes gene_type:complete
VISNQSMKDKKGDQLIAFFCADGLSCRLAISQFAHRRKK